MELTVLLNYILGGTSLAGIIGTIVYYKHNKRLKENEVKNSNTSTQRQEIELAELYKDKVLELLEQVSAKQDDGSAVLSKRLTDIESSINLKLTSIVRTQTAYNRRLTLVEKYLNGQFNDFKKRQKEGGDK
jgi:hypothetical protein